MSVFWTRGYRNDGAAIQMGLVVVRPGWVAFLPLGVPMGPSEQFALGAARTRGGAALSMNVPWQGRYPIMAWYQHGGLDVLDFEVRRALDQRGAAMFTNAEAGLVSRKYTTAFVPFAPDTPIITLDQPPPPALVGTFRPGVLPLDKRKMLTITTIATAVCMALGALFTMIIRLDGDGWNPIPLVFFGVISTVLWVAAIRNLREHARDVARAAEAGSPVGPYR